MKSPTPHKKNYFVSCTFNILTECMEGDSPIQRLPQEFIDEFILRQGSIEDIHHVYIHLYEESTEYPLFINFKKSMIYDPMKSKISDLLCSIIFKIANRDNEDYYRELLGRSVFISQNKNEYYEWGSNYFDNFPECYVQMNCGKKINLIDSSQQLKFKEDSLEAIVGEMYQVLKGTALYKHP